MQQVNNLEGLVCTQEDRAKIIARKGEDIGKNREISERTRGEVPENPTFSRFSKVAIVPCFGLCHISY